MLPDLLPQPAPENETQNYLEMLARERIIEPAENAGYELRLLGATVLPQRQTICRTKHGMWLFVDNQLDPTAKEYGGRIPVPAVQHERLVSLARAGVAPDHVWLGHELPAGWKGPEIPPLVPAPAALRAQDEALVGCVRRVLKGAADVFAVAPSTLIGQDPIVLGGVEHPSYPVVNWVLLAQWHWV